MREALGSKLQLLRLVEPDSCTDEKSQFSGFSLTGFTSRIHLKSIILLSGAILILSLAVQQLAISLHIRCCTCLCTQGGSVKHGWGNICHFAALQTSRRQSWNTLVPWVWWFDMMHHFTTFLFLLSKLIKPSTSWVHCFDNQTYSSFSFVPSSAYQMGTHIIEINTISIYQYNYTSWRTPNSKDTLTL